MAENIHIPASLSKSEKYEALLPMMKGLMEGESSRLANMANFTAALKEVFPWLWVGFYLVEGEELVLGPFQGPVACTRIAYGKGVCGTAWKEERVVVVPDVDAFPGHIACSALSKSEIVLPLRGINGDITGVLDIDSDTLNTFDTTDEYYLSQLLSLLAK